MGFPPGMEKFGKKEGCRSQFNRKNEQSMMDLPFLTVPCKKKPWIKAGKDTRSQNLYCWIYCMVYVAFLGKISNNSNFQGMYLLCDWCVEWFESGLPVYLRGKIAGMSPKERRLSFRCYEVVWFFIEFIGFFVGSEAGNSANPLNYMQLYCTAKRWEMIRHSLDKRFLL